ncbi:hypothetical protein Kpol_1014p34 [Vanderwaltozyma polyspora DSM 70294]|uniref:Gfo/Idh/MocA-like oxidoreductase N-terminal domain-containing protein n=1 Tax=Vanderwaltozyma polyspora (strain ATCC 22028 / DSM 70294 / BCRC 21397 / CBS 2163 / NBRC 10782 / NRRL Y-8283 / UCD 57-17) TaxID=436907 RepID=A7TNG1_VANPO|nr:uncharacterized protein Kpol_1014p34 [Vanderwaltozyma polyspora DSM 70294]EDO16214.1 hypothetical protein Kpol_1014p34 [Vanderwaltozyma polyspora DSM 70294]
MSQVVKVGVVGTGIFAKDRHLPSYQEMSNEFKVVAAYNRTKSKAEEFAKLANLPDNKVYDNLDEIMNDPDVDYVDALLPVQFNVDTVKKAIAAGKPIILEKPIAANMKQARELVELSDSTELPIGIAENWLYLSCIELAKKHLPRIGDVVGFTHNSTGPFVTNNKYLATTWRQSPEHIGGFLSDGGVHQLALVTSLVGEFESVSALTQQVREQSGTDDIVFSTVKIRNSKTIGTFTYGSAFGATDKSVFLKMYGTKGSVVVELSDKANPVVKVRVGETAETAGAEEVYPVSQEDSFGVNDEFLNFREAVLKKDKKLFKSSPRVAFHHLACVAAFLESSAQNGNNVTVETI